jgi:hypothetical protein
MLQGTNHASTPSDYPLHFRYHSPSRNAERLSSQPPTAASEPSQSVHVQPRGSGCAHSAEDDAVQKRITIFNETQGLQDASLDRKLTSCRRC